MRILLVVAYDGTEYCGWQKQPNATTVEGVLTKAVCDLFGANIELIGASRTDSGVHALGNVAVFDADTRMPAEKVAYALNSRLPRDIIIQKSYEVEPDFHPRHTDCRKTYEYKIYNSTFENPLCNRYTHFCYGGLDLDKMRAAAGHLVGTHDFTSFCAADTQVLDKTRTIYSLDVVQEESIITLRIRGNGFLYNMVRIIAGTLIKVGMGDIEPQSVAEIIAAKDRSLAGPTAPAKGLTLVEIRYEGEKI